MKGKLSMNPKEILHALKAGKINIEDCEKELMKLRNADSEHSSKDEDNINQKMVSSRKTFHSDKNQQPIIKIEEINPGIVQLTMQDKRNKNSFTKEFTKELCNAFEEIEQNTSYKVVILTGYDTYFATGGSKEGLEAIYNGEIKYTDTNLYKIALECKLPVIAAMQGHGIGAGWCLGMSCDFIIMSKESYYTTNFIKFGFTPGFGSTLIFPEKLGNGLANEILFTGKRYKGIELEKKGVPYEILPSKEVLSYAKELAASLAEAPRQSLIALKKHMSEGIREKLPIYIEKELKMHDATFVNQPLVKNKINSIFGNISEDIKPVGKDNSQSKDITDSDNNSIAIIGMSGQFPQSENLSVFWYNLSSGKDCVTEIPVSRWGMSKDDLENGDTDYCKWMGSLKDIDKFDPLFFNIPPRLAELIDPHERLFLECVWNLFESIGYTRETLKKTYQRKVGVYVGSMYQHYNLLESDIKKNGMVSICTNSSIANRVSYFFDFQGPSVVVDTACSSSTVAIHMACQSLLNDECEIAIAGGVNLTLHPLKFIGLGLGKIATSNPENRSFSDGDGFVPSEGVGSVLLKPLSHAIRDKDNILAVIKSTAISHGGRTNGFSVPNPNAQEDLMEYNFRKSGINPQSISYVECAANGCALGDAIEISALNKVFNKYTSKKHFCSVGSVKSNIGHAEAASGISQLLKVILQMKHKKLVPSIKAYPLNPKIKFEDTPFYLQEKLSDWETPIINIDGKEVSFPRRALINSFGGGGTNAHIIIEENTRSESLQENRKEKNNPHIIVFSARNQQQLHGVIRQMLDYIEVNEVDILSLAYTLQIGREEMKVRMATVINSREELMNSLKEYLKNTKDINERKSQYSLPIFTGNIKENTDINNNIEINMLLIENESLGIASQWVQGSKIDWMSFYKKQEVNIISLPTYPFDKQRYWIGNQKKNIGLYDLKEKAHSKNEANNKSIKEWVVDSLSNLLGIPSTELVMDRSLIDYGFDSILFMSLLKQVQGYINPSMDLSRLQTCKTTQDIIDKLYLEVNNDFMILDKIKNNEINIQNKFPELINLNGIYESKPIFWIHPGMGSVNIYNELAENLKRPFYGIQPRGFMTDRFPLHGIEAMASYYVHIIQSVQSEGPYDLGGYSLGGLLAYEITRQLQELGETVSTIIMVDSLYNEEVKNMNISKKSMFLQEVNAMLTASNSLQDIKLLIKNDEIDVELSDEEYLVKLIELAKIKGLQKTKEQLYDRIKHNIKIQSCYGLNDYKVLPLSNFENLSCHYFRNASGLFFGELEPYNIIYKDEISVDNTNYWEEWKKQIPDIKIIDSNSSNHMSIFSEGKSSEQIIKYCKKLYEQ